LLQQFLLLRTSFPVRPAPIPSADRVIQTFSVPLLVRFPDGGHVVNQERTAEMAAETAILAPEQLSALDALVDWEQSLPFVVEQILDLAGDVAGFECSPEDLVSILGAFHMKERA
jgi:hypothetical protein